MIATYSDVWATPKDCMIHRPKDGARMEGVDG